MQSLTPRTTFISHLDSDSPKAIAWITGKDSSSPLSGLVKFYNTTYGGVLIEAEIFGLPNIDTPQSTDFYGMHIHEFGNCSQAFTQTGDHYNPTAKPHPFHAGDLIPLFGNQGYAWCAFYDKRFTINEIMGRSVIIHSHSDDFMTQPSGNSGEKIGCGVIRPAY